MRELVIVITDLDARDVAAAAGAPGLARAARYGTSAPLASGWRAGVLEWLGQPQLAAVAPARMAAAALGVHAPDAGTTCWIATPLQLVAGPAQVWLPHGGLLRLTAAEQDGLAADFSRFFGADDSRLLPLPAGEFLLVTPGIAPLPAAEPASCAGREIAATIPQVPAAGAIRRLMAELEMWLHGHPVNAQRIARGVPPVTTLWPWGAGGAPLPAVPGAPIGAAAYGCDAWLDGLWHRLGGERGELPPALDAVLAGTQAERVLLALRAGEEIRSAGANAVAAALGNLDARFVVPALAALRSRRLGRVSVFVRDRATSLGRRSHLRFWRRAPPAAAAPG